MKNALTADVPACRQQKIGPMNRKTELSDKVITG
jgi:hypothetical protein